MARRKDTAEFEREASRLALRPDLSRASFAAVGYFTQRVGQLHEWHERSPSTRALENWRLAARIRPFHLLSGRACGSPPSGAT
jgi:hypothetical protein